MNNREMPSEDIIPISGRLDPDPRPVTSSISREAGKINLPFAVSSALVIASFGLAACQPVRAETPVPGGASINTPAAEVVPASPLATEIVSIQSATETPVPDFSKPSIFRDLFLGQYKIDGVLHSEGSVPGYDTEVNTYYREGSDLPVGFAMTDSYLMTYYGASTDKRGVTSGKTPDGRAILKKGNVWVLEKTGDTFVPFVASLAGKPFGDPVFTADGKLAIVDGTTGAVIPGGDPRDPYQKPADIAKYYGFIGDPSQVTGVDVNANGNLVVFGKNNEVLANLAFFAKAEVLLEQQPIAIQAVNEFVSTLNTEKINITAEQLLSQGLKVTEVTINGKNYQIASVHLDPDKAKSGERGEGDWPIMIKSEDGEWLTKFVTREIATSADFNLAVLLGGYGSVEDYEKLVEMQKAYFNSGTVFIVSYDSGWNQTEPSDLGPSVSDTQIATSAKMSENVGTLLFWPNDIPLWLKMPVSENQMLDIMRKRLEETVGSSKFKGIDAWIVANEDGWGTQGNIYREALGNDWVVKAFQEARKLNPDATLIYNDFGNETISGFRYGTTKKIIDQLKGVDNNIGVGLEMHLTWEDKDISVDDVVKAMQSYGVPVYVTEFDVRMDGFTGTEAEKNLIQADIYSKMLKAAVSSGVCKQFTIFGLIDRLSVWETPGRFQVSNAADPLLFDDEFNPKLAYYAVIKGMLEGLSVNH